MFRQFSFAEGRMAYNVTPVINTVSNFYLIRTEGACFLIDTGASFSRGLLKKALAAAGCTPDNLKMVVITHADADHTGNIGYLRKQYGLKVAMHRAEQTAAQAASMKLNRKTRFSGFSGALMVLAGKLMSRPFQPDLLLADDEDLSPYGFDAKVIHTPGHSLGSISIFTKEGDLFCGDFLNNNKAPSINHLVDDMEEMKTSLAKIRNLPVKKIYPGHGAPFTLEELLQNVGSFERQDKR